MLIKNYEGIPSGYYVYKHSDEFGNILYIGKGSGDRAIRKRDRSKEWSDFENNNSIIVDILVSGLEEKSAVEKEMYFLEKLNPMMNKRRGYCVRRNPTKPTISAGDIFKSNSKGECQVVEYYDATRIRCKYTDQIGYEFMTSATHLRRGEFKNKARFGSKVNAYGEVLFIGTYDTPEEAYSAYLKTKKDYVIFLSNKYKEVLKPRVFDALVNMSWLM